MAAWVESKLSGIGESIFSTMSRMAHECGAINLSQGFPEFQPPQALIEAVHKALLDGYNQYAPMPGLPLLREAIAGKCAANLGYILHPETEITIVPGATAGIFCAVQALVHAGDEVIIIEPAYDCYAPAIKLAGAVAKSVALDPRTGEIPWDQVRKLINIRTRMIMVNTPHNPTGWVLSEADWAELERIVLASDLLLLSDEVYEYMVFDGQKHRSAASIESLKDRSIRLSSFGKTYHATGWKLGYISAAEPITKRIREVYQFMAFSASTPMQMGLAQFMRAHTDHETSVAALYQSKRDFLAQALKASRFQVLPCQGSYFQLVDYGAISQAPDREFAEQLTREYGIASIPLSPFFRNDPGHTLLRLCFAKENQTLAEAAKRLCEI